VSSPEGADGMANVESPVESKFAAPVLHLAPLAIVVFIFNLTLTQLFLVPPMLTTRAMNHEASPI